MSVVGCKKQFTIVNGQHKLDQTDTALSTEVQITYEGCDFLKLPPRASIQSLIHNSLIALPTVSNYVLLRCKIAGHDRVFYVNKEQRTILEIHDPEPSEIEQSIFGDTEITPRDYQSHSIPIKKIAIIAEKSQQPQLIANAKRAKNIELKLTGEQRRQTLMLMDDSKINFKNTCYTYAFQGYLAKFMQVSMHEKIELELEARHENHDKNTSTWNALTHFISSKLFNSNKEKIDKIDAMQRWAQQLHGLSAQFKPFESFINNPGANPNSQLNELNNVFKEYTQSIQNEIDTIINIIQESDPKRKQKTRILTGLKDTLKKGIDSFQVQLDELMEHPTKEKIDRLVCIVDRDLFIKSLGSFMQEQMDAILDAGIKIAYKISNQRVSDVVQVPRLVAHLSDVQHMMLLKGQSIVEGPKDNDTYSITPKSMIDSITDSKPIQPDAEAKWFSIKPYLNKWNPLEVDKILCVVTGNPLVENNRKGNSFYHFVVQPLKLFASIFEIVFSIPRLILIAILGLIETVLAITSVNPKKPELKITFYLNQLIINFYRDYSLIVAPLTYLKNSSWNEYQRKKNGEPGNQHQDILNACTDYSGFCYSLFIYFTPQLISDSIHEFFTVIIQGFVKIPQELYYLTSSNDKSDAVYQQVKIRHDIILSLQTMIEKRYPQPLLYHSKNTYDLLTYCRVNHISSPLDVFYDVAVTLSNSVVNPMFRKSPGIATFFFAISIATLGTYLAPATSIAWLKSLPAWLQYPTNQISLHFTGKSTTLGIQEQVVACFLEWKLGFFSTEFAVEMAHGHYEIFESLFEEPEQIILGLVGLIGLGVALQYVPELPTTIKIPGLPDVPNFYFQIINVFTEEAKGCAEGTIGLTGIEYGFLGLKFAMLMHSMLSGSEEHHDLTKIEKLVLACGKQSFFKQLINELKAIELIKLVEKTEFKDRLTSELSRDDLTIFDPGMPDDIELFANCLTKAVNTALAEQGLSFETNELNLFKTSLAKQLLDVPAFLELQTVGNTFHSLIAPKPLTVETSDSVNIKSPTIEQAHHRLSEAIEMMRDKKNPLVFSSSLFGIENESNQFYDYLDKCFEDYNDAVMHTYKERDPVKYEKLKINKRPFLDVFYNKYCYKQSNNFIRSIIFFIYPISVTLRGLKFFWAWMVDKPSMKHQIIKNFSKDLVILSQIIGPLARMTADFNLYLTGTARGIAFIATLSIALTVYPLFFATSKLANTLQQKNAPVTPFDTWFEFLDDWICYLIAFHKTPALQPLRQLFVRAARTAGTNSDLIGAAEKIKIQLDETAALEHFTQNPTNSSRLIQSLLPTTSKAIAQTNWHEDTLPKLFQMTLEEPKTDVNFDEISWPTIQKDCTMSHH
ncbi:MAG: hypothetical protein Q8R83_05165 [Legionellaceae bacterium]|nr:hypothetical protein [Legionellaceae bacterium]